MTEASQQLHAEEFAALHQEMNACMAQLAMVEIASVIGAIAIFAWVAVNAEVLVGFAGLVWFAPVFVAVFGMLKALAIRRHASLIARDLRELSGRGARQLQPSAQRWTGRRWSSAVAWLLFLALTLVGSGLGFIQFRSECSGPMWNICGQDDGDDGDSGGQEPNSLKQGTHLPAGRARL